jgi:hypothetical protein
MQTDGIDLIISGRFQIDFELIISFVIKSRLLVINVAVKDASSQYELAIHQTLMNGRLPPDSGPGY